MGIYFNRTLWTWLFHPLTPNHPPSTLICQPTLAGGWPWIWLCNVCQGFSFEYRLNLVFPLFSFYISLLLFYYALFSFKKKLKKAKKERYEHNKKVLNFSRVFHLLGEQLYRSALREAILCWVVFGNASMQREVEKYQYFKVFFYHIFFQTILLTTHSWSWRQFFFKLK